MIENSINGDDMKAEIAEEAARRAAIDCARGAVREEGLGASDEDIDGMFAGEETPRDPRGVGGGVPHGGRSQDVPSGARRPTGSWTPPW